MYTMMDVKYTQEDFFMSAEFLDFILEVVISYLVPILELIGVFIVAYGTIKSFIKFIHWELKMERQTEHAEREHAKIQEKTK